MPTRIFTGPLFGKVAQVGRPASCTPAFSQFPFPSLLELSLLPRAVFWRILAREIDECARQGAAGGLWRMRNGRMHLRGRPRRRSWQRYGSVAVRGTRSAGHGRGWTAGVEPSRRICGVHEAYRDILRTRAGMRQNRVQVESGYSEEGNRGARVIYALNGSVGMYLVAESKPGGSAES